MGTPLHDVFITRDSVDPWKGWFTLPWNDCYRFLEAELSLLHWCRILFTLKPLFMLISSSVRHILWSYMNLEKALPKWIKSAIYGKLYASPTHYINGGFSVPSTIERCSAEASCPVLTFQLNESEKTESTFTNSSIQLCVRSAALHLQLTISLMEKNTDQIQTREKPEMIIIYKQKQWHTLTGRR